MTAHTKTTAAAEVPTTKDVRTGYALSKLNGQGFIDAADVLDGASTAFDRWLAEHDAQVRREAKVEALREWAAAMLDRYPEDVFVPPVREDWTWLGRLVSQHGGVLDAFSAEIMRRAAHIAIKDADRIEREEGRS